MVLTWEVIPTFYVSDNCQESCYILNGCLLNVESLTDAQQKFVSSNKNINDVYVPHQ